MSIIISLYAASKTKELIAHVAIHNLPATGLRFTVYGSWATMAYFKFVKAISEGKPIDVYN